MKTLLLTTALLSSLTMGAAWADDQGGNAGQHDHFMPFSDVLSKFPPADAAAVRDSYKASHEKNHAVMDQAHKLREERQAIISADKFDENAYLAKSAAIMKAEDQMRTTSDKNFADALTKLPPDERKQLAAAMANFHQEHGPMHHKDDAGKPNAAAPANAKQ